MSEASRVRVSGPLAVYAPELIEYLNARGYCDGTAAEHVRRLKFLSQWMGRCRVRPGAVDEAAVSRALTALHRTGKGERFTTKSYGLVLSFLRSRGVVPSAVPSQRTPIEVVLDDYRTWLRAERGLAETTIAIYMHAAQRFAADACGGDAGRIAGLSAGDVSAFVLRVAERRRQSRKTIVTFLSNAEIAALLAAPNRDTWIGRRDHALLATALQTGLRVSELVGLRCHDIALGAGAHVRCHGKGRKERATPLTRHTAAVLKTWIAELGTVGDTPLFPTRRGGPIAADSVGDLVDRYVVIARQQSVEWASKKVTPHTLRHTAAMQLLEAGVDTSVIALFLGHEHIQTTQIYLHGDLGMKERALARTTPPNTKPGRYKPPDKLLAFLEGL